MRLLDRIDVAIIFLILWIVPPLILCYIDNYSGNVAKAGYKPGNLLKTILWRFKK